MSEQRGLSTDTIAALITPPGRAGVSVVRLSGPQTRSIILSAAQRAQTILSSPRTLVLSALQRLPESGGPGEILDKALVAYFPAPNSYTGEDCAEFNVHGSPLLVDQLLEMLHLLGARCALPGEFTQRAFLNGRMDLTQAEAVADLINAETELQARCAKRQLAGGMSRVLDAAAEPLRRVLAEIEAFIDFPDEDIDCSFTASWKEKLNEAAAMLRKHLAAHNLGRLCREGAQVVLAGPVNAGKSSLLNALAGRERAIVTAHPGTTRDAIEHQLDIDGLLVRLWDTAGIREEDEGRGIHEVERLGIARTWESIRSADLVLYVFDPLAAIESQEAGWRQTADEAGAAAPLINKSDLLEAGRQAELQRQVGRTTGIAPLVVSAKEGAGLEEIGRLIKVRLLGDEKGSAARAAVVCSRRHREALAAAVEQTEKALAALDGRLPPEITSLELRGALGALSDLIGVTTSEDILSRIFSSFCIGK